MAIHITKSELIGILNDKFQDVQATPVPLGLNQELQKISLFRLIVSEYFNFVMNLSQVLFLKETISWIDRKYPYISCIENFLELTEWVKFKKEKFSGFQGFTFIDVLRRETSVNGQHDLHEFCLETKRSIQYLHHQVIHKLKITSVEDLNHIPKKYVNERINGVDDKIFFNPDENTLIYLGEPIHTYTTGKFPLIILSTVFEDKVPRYAIPLNKIANKINVKEIGDDLKNFKKVVKSKLKKNDAPPELVEDFIIRKPSDTIEVSKIFQRI